MSQLSPQQMFQITHHILDQTRNWLDNSHRASKECHKSIHHTKLLINLFLSDLIRKAQQEEQNKRMEVLKKLPPNLALGIMAANVVKEKMPSNDTFNYINDFTDTSSQSQQSSPAGKS